MDPNESRLLAMQSRLTLLEWQLDTLMVVNCKLIEATQARSVHDVHVFTRVMQQAIAEMGKALDLAAKLRLQKL